MPKRSAPISNPAIAVEHLNVRYGDVPVVEDVSFHIAPGTITAVIGPNGSGKTTLLKAVLDLVPHTGHVMLLGGNLHDMRGRIGYVPQRFDFDRTLPITVKEFLDLARHPDTTNAHIAHTLRDVGLPANVAQRRIGALSGGQLQRVLIAQAILNDPAILFLDEPSTGIDVAGEAAIYDVLAHLKDTHGTTIFLISHDIGTIGDVVDQVICLNRRLVCIEKPEKALTTKRLSELYGGHIAHPGHHHH